MTLEISGKRTGKVTPLMQQYYAIKDQHPGELLLFRMGDFYELFDEDAKVASEVLNIALTQRNKKSNDSTLMCGFPHHSMETPINKLLDAGFRVAVCDQLEDPQEAKGIVKRGVTLRLSPGVVFNPSQLIQDESVYLMAFDESLICLYEPSTGKALYSFIKEKAEIQNFISKYNPKEILLKEEKDKKYVLASKALIQVIKNEKDPRELLLKHVESMQGEGAVFGFTNWIEIKRQELAYVNTQFFNHIEVFKSNQGDKKKSLFSAIKKTKTPGGARLLRDYLENPLQTLETIEARFSEIKKWQNDFARLEEFRKKISYVGDLERRVARAGHPLGNPQDLFKLSQSLYHCIEAFLGDTKPEIIQLQEFLEGAIDEEAPSQWQSKGGYIKKGFSKDLDALIELSQGAQSEIQKLEEREKQKTGISSLKIRFNNVFGFYIEVTKTHKNKVPQDYVRKQTLTNAERYTTDELSSLEEKVLTAKSKRVSLEKEIFQEVKEEVKKYLPQLREITDRTHNQDVYSSLAYLCIEKGFSIPEFNDEHKFSVQQGFHPVVVEDLVQKESSGFIQNDFTINKEKSFYLITGPNMAGKSTMMKQVLLVSYLAQCGIPVPAKSASLPVYDAFFTRVGASDVLSEGLSTFMLEMKETAEILNKATTRSLLVLDEIGRGTSSLDGAALAQSIVNYIHETVKCHTLFATHYHEITRLEKNYKALINIHMGYYEKEGQIKFTYKVKEGASKKSYGIEVANLAGVPTSIIEEAFRLTQNPESKKVVQELEQLNFFDPNQDKEPAKQQALLEELSQINTLSMTPLEALTKLSKWQEDFL